MKVIKKSAVILSILLSMSACANASKMQPKSRTYNDIDITEPVNLTMYLIGERTQDFDAVYERVNELLSEKLNTTLTVQFVPADGKWSGYEQLFLSGEEFDLIFTASGWGYYESIAGMGGFYEMTPEFIASYAPDINILLPEDAWQQAAINGHIYMLPGYTREYGMDVIGVRGDLMEKYGYEDLASPDELESFLRDVAANESYITPMGSRSGSSLPSFFLYPGMRDVTATPYAFFVYNVSDPTDNSIIYTIDTPEFITFAKKMKEFKNLGFWSSNTLSSTETRADSWLQGSAAIMVWNISAVSGFARQINALHPEWKATFIDVSRSTPKQINAYINNGMAINSQSRHPERAMMVLNELMTNSNLYDLTTLGIEGIHWQAIGENHYLSLEDYTKFPPFRTCCWGWRNQEIEREEYVDESDPVYLKLQETLTNWDSQQKKTHPYSSFSFNSAPVEDIQQTIETIANQYYLPIAAGLVDDPEAAVEDLRQRLAEAGIYEMYEEMQKQAAEHWNSAAHERTYN